MQQSDFRAFLSSRPVPETASTYVPIKQRKEPSVKDEKPQQGFKPRSAKSKGKLKEAEEATNASQWRDRAKERREGQEDVARPSKGLDFAALERDRQDEQAQAELAAEGDLEAAFLAQETAPPPASKRTREEILAELREQQTAAKGATTDVELAAARAEGKFKRVGEKEKKLKAAAGATATVVDPKTGKVKKLRKKKVKNVAEVTTPTVAPADPSLPAPAPAMTTEAAESDGGGEGDIFADAADYDPFQSDESDTEDAGPSIAKPRAKLFDDEDQEIRAEPLAAPALRPVPVSASANPASKTRRARDSDSDEAESPPTRLEGFADSNDIRSLLEIDKAAIKDEKRRERKERQRALAAGEAPPPKKAKTLTDKDKLNRDFLQYENFIAKKS